MGRIPPPRRRQMALSDSAGAARAGGESGDDSDQIIAQASGQVAEEESAMWEADGAGFLRLDFDPVTQRRLRVATNDAASWQFGMRCEEALARFAVGDIAMPYTDMDVMRYFVAELATSRRGVQSFYGRIIRPSGPGGGVSAVLFCRTALRVFDAQGRVITTKHVIRFISPDDYDEAVRMDPSCCPHVITGDHRCGRQLIADAAIDAHVQLAGMAAAVRGRTELNALADFAESAAAVFYGTGLASEA